MIESCDDSLEKDDVIYFDFGRPRSKMMKRRFFRRFFTFLDILSRSTFFVYGRCSLSQCKKKEVRKHSIAVDNVVAIDWLWKKSNL